MFNDDRDGSYFTFMVVILFMDLKAAFLFYKKAERLEILLQV